MRKSRCDFLAKRGADRTRTNSAGSHNYSLPITQSPLGGYAVSRFTPHGVRNNLGRGAFPMRHKNGAFANRFANRMSSEQLNKQHQLRSDYADSVHAYSSNSSGSMPPGDSAPVAVRKM